MNHRKTLTKKLGISLIILISLTCLSPMVSSYTSSETELEINAINGGLGGVTADIKNIGNEVANDIVIIITINGGIFGNIDVIKECSGCSSCGTTLAPGAIKSESTLEAKFLIGLGSVDITVVTYASNADEVSESITVILVIPICAESPIVLNVKYCPVVSPCPASVHLNTPPLSAVFVITPLAPAKNVKPLFEAPSEKTPLTA